MPTQVRPLARLALLMSAPKRTPYWQAGKPAPQLSRRPALKHLDAPVAQLIPDSILRVGGEGAPEMGRVPQFRLSVVHPQVDRASGPAMDNDAVESGGFELGRPETPGLRVAGETCDGRFGRGGHTGLAGERGTRNDTGHHLLRVSCFVFR